MLKINLSRQAEKLWRNLPVKTGKPIAKKLVALQTHLYPPPVRQVGWATRFTVAHQIVSSQTSQVGQPKDVCPPYLAGVTRRLFLAKEVQLAYFYPLIIVKVTL